MTVAMKPIYDYSRIKRIIVSTYQAVSGAGAGGPMELENQMKAMIDGRSIEHDVFKHQILNNVIPHIDVWQEDDYTKEEMKMVYETQKIFDDKDLAITATTVRVPVIRSHSESIYMETEDVITVEKARALFEGGEGLVLMDDPRNDIYPMPLMTSDTDDVYVGRIRRDLFQENALNYWVVADQIRKGAATNAVQIGEMLLKDNLL